MTSVTERREEENETHRIYKLVGILWLVKLSEGDWEEGQEEAEEERGVE